MAKPKMRIIPLGGLGEIGKNMTVFELGNDAIIIDSGIMFPTNDMFGVDYIIPDYKYLIERTDLKIHGILFTHGHEDHIGAVTHVLESLGNIPLYATRLTAGLINVKIVNGRHFDDGVTLDFEPKMNIFQAGDKLHIGPFKIEPFRMTHSIPDCVGFAIETPM
ncbi:MAG: ribonuclease J, partial [Anaerolineae bacterium]|nr:ribonuclease J [Anaerolineae bacterium]